MRSRRFLAALAVLFIAALTAWYLLGRTTVASSRMAALTVVRTAGDPHAERAGASAMSRVSTEEAANFARAVAALGASDDGDDSLLSQLSPSAKLFLPQARDVLGPRLECADNSIMRVMPPAMSGGATTIENTDDGPRLLAPGIWASVELDPRERRRLVITDAVAAGYAICIRTAEVGTLRVDGQLIVPGRFYRIQERITISSESACGIDIRPLPALTSPCANLLPSLDGKG